MIPTWTKAQLSWGAWWMNSGVAIDWSMLMEIMCNLISLSVTDCGIVSCSYCKITMLVLVRCRVVDNENLMCERMIAYINNFAFNWHTLRDPLNTRTLDLYN